MHWSNLLVLISWTDHGNRIGMHDNSDKQIQAWGRLTTPGWLAYQPLNWRDYVSHIHHIHPAHSQEPRTKSLSVPTSSINSTTTLCKVHFFYMLFISSNLIHPCFCTTHLLFSAGLSKLIFLQVNSHKIDSLCVTKAALRTFCQISFPWERYKSRDHSSTNRAITNLCTCRYQAIFWRRCLGA